MVRKKSTLKFNVYEKHEKPIPINTGFRIFHHRCPLRTEKNRNNKNTNRIAKLFGQFCTNSFKEFKGFIAWSQVEYGVNCFGMFQLVDLVFCELSKD